MPSNKDLAEEAQALAQELGIEVDTADLNNKDLAELVSDLKAKKTDAEKDTQADQGVAPTAVPRRAEKKVESEVVCPEFVVAPGKSLAVKRGILDAGDEVRKDDLDTESFENFFNRKYIVNG